MAETTNKEETKVAEAAKEDKKSEAAKKTAEKRSTATAKKETKADAIKDAEIEKGAETIEAEPEESKDDTATPAEQIVEEAVESTSEPEIHDNQESTSTSVNADVTDEQSSPDSRAVKATESKFPIAHALTHPVTIYRAPAGSFAGRSFGGVLIITGEDANGFTPVKLNRSGIGIQTGYVRTVDLQ